MKGHWQKEIPSKNGHYWTATRQGQIAQLQVVAYDDGELVYAGGPAQGNGWIWQGWWWSEPVEEPSKPPEW